VDEGSETIKNDMWTYFFESGMGVTEGVANGMPWSGSERNHLFFGGVQGEVFSDYSGITGMDDPGDGRAFALLDYDRDGRQDVLLASPGEPRFRLLRNGLGQRVGADNGFIAVRLVGGNHTAEPSAEWSARDGYGTAVRVTLDDVVVFREHQPEGGVVGQHSNTMIIGIGDRAAAKRLELRWLSGKVQAIDNVPARKLVTVYENPAQSPTDDPFVVQDYVREIEPLRASLASADFWKTRFLPSVSLTSTLDLQHEGRALKSPTGLTVVATMATWCAACVAEMPEFRGLREAFNDRDLTIVAVPVDPDDTAEMLEEWAARYQPPYKIAAGIDPEEIARVNAVTLAELRTEAVPATFLIDSQGRVLMARWGVPTISDVRGFLWRDRADRGDLLAKADIR
jgi:peroxiredoxin